MDTKGPENRMSIQKSEEGRTPAGDNARRELESQRHLREPHVIEPPLEAEDMQSNVPVSQVGERHNASNPLVDVLPQNATDALAEATHRRHAHVDRARSGSSTIHK